MRAAPWPSPTEGTFWNWDGNVSKVPRTGCSTIPKSRTFTWGARCVARETVRSPALTRRDSRRALGPAGRRRLRPVPGPQPPGHSGDGRLHVHLPPTVGQYGRAGRRLASHTRPRPAAHGTAAGAVLLRAGRICPLLRRLGPAPRQPEADRRGPHGPAPRADPAVRDDHRRPGPPRDP